MLSQFSGYRTYAIVVVATLVFALGLIGVLPQEATNSILTGLFIAGGFTIRAAIK